MFYKMFKKIRHDARGATMVEFAFAAPVLLILTFGFFEFSRVLFTQGILHYSAAEATRYAMVNFDPNVLDEDYIAEVKLGIKGVVSDNFILIDETKISRLDVDVTVNPGDATKTVSITIEYDYSMIMPIIPQANFTLVGNSQSFLVQ